MTDLKGRAIVITGASSGIGRAAAITLGRAGADLWLTGRSKKELDETSRLVAAAGGTQAEVAAFDLGDRGPLAALIERADLEHPYLFAVINNAGLMHPEPILSGSMERWQAMLDVNIMAVLEGSTAGIKAMRRHGKPAHIINIGSLQSRFEVGGVYGLTKRAVEIIGASLRAELEQDQIRIATIIPGGFATQLARGLAPAEKEKLISLTSTPGSNLDYDALSRTLGDPQHVADAIHYVLTRHASINFQEILIRPPVDMKL